MKEKKTIRLQVVDRNRFRWTLVGVALLFLVLSTLWAFSYYQSILKARPVFTPANNQTINTIQNATGKK